MPNAILRVGPYRSPSGNFVDPDLESLNAPVNCNKVNWVNDNWGAKSNAFWQKYSDYEYIDHYEVVGLGQAASYSDWGDPEDGDGPTLTSRFYYQAAQDTTITLSWSFDDNATDPQTISYEVYTLEDGFSSADSITPPQAPPFSYSGTFTVDLVATTLGIVFAKIDGPVGTDNINGNEWSLKFS